MSKKTQEMIFDERFKRHKDELKWLYMEMYGNDSMYAELEGQMRRFYKERNSQLKKLDLQREENPDWYKSNNMMGMCLYIDNFAGNLKGVKEKISYIEDCGVNYVHLMPFLDTVDGRSDGGYAVADFRKVKPELGTMKDLAEFAAECHKKDISVCMDFVMNHTSEDHEWAKKARQGDGEYMSRYFFCENDKIPNEYEKTVPQVFPETAPGNFTWLPEINHFVLTTFYPYQWDLNYKNPRVFNEMMYNFLYLANQGIDIFRIDAVPYIWKELGTDCRNRPRVHTVVRLMRMIGEIVCPGIIFLGEVVMEPAKVVPYFGTLEKPECHMLYNVTTMCTIWHTLATRNVKLLKRQLDTIYSLPKDYVFLNYLRCHDDLGWGLDYGILAEDGMTEGPHKKYLNDYYLGKDGGSHSRGELYNYDPVTGDARFCGTTASMCGIEAAIDEKNKFVLGDGIKQDIMLHAFMMAQSGIPILYSGDEIGQLNDYSYKNDPNKAVDSRYVHRGKFDWEAAEKRNNPLTVEGKIFSQLKKLEEIRKSEKAFVSNADCWTVETYDDSIICIGRYYEGDKIFGIFNFSEDSRIAWIDEKDGIYRDLITGDTRRASGVEMAAHGFIFLKKI